jgi:hypothetical protein
MQWMLQDTVGDYPLPSRAHSATLIDRKIVIIGGGLGPYITQAFISLIRPLVDGTSLSLRQVPIQHLAVPIPLCSTKAESGSSVVEMG